MNSTEFTKNSLAEAGGNPKPQSVDRVIKDNIMADQISKDSEGNYIFRMGYYYRPSKIDASDWAENISKKLRQLGIDNTVIQAEDIWKPFKGGAPLKSQSHYFAKVRLNSADSVGEGYRVVPSIDRERYQERTGLEGPIRAENGKVVYYDPVEGKYIDPDTDIYISHSDWQAMNQRDIQEGDDWGSMSKSEFKRREMEHELGHEDNPRRYRSPKYNIKPKGMYFYNVPMGKEVEAQQAGLKQSKSGKWYGYSDNMFGKGKYWEPKNEGVAEGYWQDAVKKAEADREARQGKPFERNPASHDKHGVYVGDKDLAGEPVPKRKQSDVSEAGYDFNKPYGVKYKVFGSRDGRIVTKEFWASTPEKLEKAVAKIEALDNFYEIDGYHDPRPDQQSDAGEVQQVDELKTGTLMRYATKAGKSGLSKGIEAGRKRDMGDDEGAAALQQQSDKRYAGQSRALGKIASRASDSDKKLKNQEGVAEAKTFGDITIDDGIITKDGKKIGTVMHQNKYGYHPSVLLKSSDHSFSKWYELDQKNLIDTIVADVRKYILKSDEEGVAEAFADQGSGHTGTSREDKRIAALLKAKNMPAKTKPIKKVAAEAKTLKKRVRVVKGEHADKTGWIREIKHGAFKGAPKSFNVDLDDGGQADNLPASSLRLVKDQQGVAEATGDVKFDKMLKGITSKKAVAKQQKTDSKQQARDAFDDMFGGGNPADKLSIRKKGVAEGIDRENPIVKEYYALMKNDIKTLRNLLKQQTKIIDTSEYTTKDHAVSAYLHNKHGSKRVNAAFGLDEQGVAEAAPKKKAPLAKELNFHGYTIRVSNKPNAEKQFTGIAFLPGKEGSVRQERFVGASSEEVESKAKNWVLSFNERRTWDNIKDSHVTVDFNSEFIKNYRQGNDNFWSKFTMLDNNTPAFLIAPDSAEDEFGVEILRGEGYSKASPKKIATTGEIGNTSVTNIAKVRAVKAGLIPNGRYTLEKSNKKTKSLGSDIFTLAYHSTVDAPNAPMRLSDPGVTIAANRKIGEASDKRPKYVVTTKDKPRKVKPTKTGQSAHPYQGKMVGEQQKHSSAYSKGFSDGVYGQRDPRASSYGPGVDDYDAGFAAGLEHEKQQKQQRATKYQSDIAPYMSMTMSELEAEQQQIKKQRDAISDMAKRGKLSAEQNQKYRELGDQFQIIHQAKFQKQQNPDMQESSKKKDACYNKVKSRYKIWPSAYASGALVKCRKVGADKWGNN